VVIDKTIFVHTKFHVTLNSLELHGPRYTSGGAYAAPPLGRIMGRPVFIVTRVVFYDVGRWLGWSSNRHYLVAAHALPVPASLIRVSRKSLRFYSHRIKIKGFYC